MSRLRGVLVWGALGLAMAGPVLVAAGSPWLAWRGPVYIAAGFAGILALALMLVQPLLAAGYLPGLALARSRRWHRRIGAGILGGIVLHVGGLYVTSPPDTLDALLLVSPTPFSIYGVIGLWSAVVTAVLVALRGRLGWRPGFWRIVHNVLALVVVGASIVHALMIEGTMGQVSKAALCAVILAASVGTVVHLRLLRPRRP